jgi:ABC-type dipeptide/oligopeptide/nickel transport system permease subunit
VSVGVDPSIVVDVPAAAPEEAAIKARGYWEAVWIRFRRDRLAVISLGFVIFLFLGAFAGGPIAAHLLGHGPNTINLSAVTFPSDVPVGPWSHVSLAPYPGAKGHYGSTLYILGGADQTGTDMFLRLLYGAQTSLEVGVLSTFFSVGLGVIMGLLAGYFRGWVDTVISRLIEIVMVFPVLLFIIGIDIVAGPQLNNITFGVLQKGVFTLVLIFSIFGWFYPARIMRGVILSLREKEFVEAARMTGASDFRIMRSHLLPHLVAPIIVYSSILVAANILGEAGLSFIGLGIVPPTASWGNLLAQAPNYVQTDVWILLLPGIAILLTTIAFNLLGDGLRDAFDPRSRI